MNLARASWYTFIDRVTTMWGMAHLDEWRPVMAMLVFNLISAVMTALVKEALQQGLNSLVLITLRQLVATVFLAPIAYFKERYLKILHGGLQCIDSGTN